MNVSRKKYCLSVLFMIAALLFTACSGTDLQTEKTNMPPEDENLIVIGVSQLGSESMWRTANTNSLRETSTFTFLSIMITGIPASFASSNTVSQPSSTIGENTM